MIQPIVYRDKSGVLKGTLNNRFDPENTDQSSPLLITLAGVAFEGSSYNGLEPVSDDEKVPGLSRFEFTRFGILDTSTFHFELVNYQFEFEQDIKIVEINSGHELEVVSAFKVDKYAKDDKITLRFNLQTEELAFSSDSFEGLFDLVIAALEPSYYLKNCYGCAYSDYSPYGNDTFGTLMCFRNCKSAYSKVKNKAAFFEVLKLNQDITVQETYLCDQFKERVKGTGYRG